MAVISASSHSAVAKIYLEWCKKRKTTSDQEFGMETVVCQRGQRGMTKKMEQICHNQANHIQIQVLSEKAPHRLTSNWIKQHC